MTTFQWQELPQNLDALKQLPEAGLKTPEETAALTVAARCVRWSSTVSVAVFPCGVIPSESNE